MDNSFFILSKQKVTISRFHICTWDIENSNAFIELGIEFSFPLKGKEVDFKFVAPFVKEKDNIKCLLNELKDSNNSKFIFNDIVVGNSPINRDDRHGTILDFEIRGKLGILPVNDIKIENGLVSFKLKKPKNIDCKKYYIRFLINTISKTLSTEHKGIAKTNYIYDIKVNEKRNLPDEVAKLTNNHRLCKIKDSFCLHVVPNSFEVSFVDQNKLKNVRVLEVSAFKKYLPKELKTMKLGKYVIVFNKYADKESYSFFTIFTKETIGREQMFFAIGMNIACSLLFGISTLRRSFIPTIVWYKQIPLEYWLAIIILITFLCYLFFPKLKRIYTNKT